MLAVIAFSGLSPKRRALAENPHVVIFPDRPATAPRLFGDLVPGGKPPGIVEAAGAHFAPDQVGVGRHPLSVGRRVVKVCPLPARLVIPMQPVYEKALSAYVDF